jgi:hypothetical protein
MIVIGVDVHKHSVSAVAVEQRWRMRAVACDAAASGKGR